MSRRMVLLITLTITLPLALLTTCSTSGLSEEEEDEAAIYAAVARQLYTVDHTFGYDPPDFPLVYLVGYNHSPRGENEYIDIGESVKTAVVTALSDLPAQFIWVQHRDEVPIDDRTGGVVINGLEGYGAILDLGSIELQEDGSVQVTASIYIGNLAGGGTIYILEKVGDNWRIVGNTGVRWIS